MTVHNKLSPRAWHAMVIALFALWLIGPGLVGVLTRDSKTSEGENRSLAQWPGAPASLSGLKEWTVELNSYLRDQVGFRRSLTRFHARALYALGVSANKRVALGVDSFLFARTIETADDLVEQVSGLRALSSACIGALVERYQEQEAFVRQHEAVYLVTIVPNKASVYRDKLPRWWRAHVSDDTTLHRLERAAVDANVSFLGLQDVLTAAARKRQIWRRDDSHWNSNGAFAAYKAMGKRLTAAGAAPRPLRLSDEDIERQTRTEKIGDLARLLGLRRVQETVTTATVRNKPRELDREETKVKGQVRQLRIKTDLEDAPRILIHSDSFVWALFEFLVASSSEVLWTRGISSNLPLTMVERFRPDIVLVLQVEKGLLECPLE